MTPNSRPVPHIIRSASVALRRMSAAFGLAHASFDIDVVLAYCGDFALELSYDPGDGSDPFIQARDLHLRGHPGRLSEVARTAVGQMFMNVALAYRAPQPIAPTGWSIHPVAASIIAAAGTAFPNPADPLTWLRWEASEIRLPDGGNIVGATFKARENVLILDHARIVDAAGNVVATLHTDGPTLTAASEGAFPETCAGALAGRRADSLCSVFAADPRGASARIEMADTSSGESPFLLVHFEDSLVPLLASSKGRERWRPRTARSVTGSRMATHHLRYMFSHRSSIMAIYAKRRRLFVKRAVARQAHTPTV